MCSCIEAIDQHEVFKASNTVCLVNLIGPPRAVIETYTEKKVRGKKPPILIATFCPFCGAKYEKEAA